MVYKVPESTKIEGLEEKWSSFWEENNTFRFNRANVKSRGEVFSIDTPPPTVSGSLHMGHIFSYTHTDIVVRYQRMNGKEIFYPMGWDDNGLPTERRVQNYFGVTCDPELAYDANFEIPAKPFDPPIPISRPNFVELCLKLTQEDEKTFEDLWRHLGISVDWSMTYATIGKDAQRVSQLGFLRLLESKSAYQAFSPTLWDVDFKTAVAQAELEDREVDGAYHQIKFYRESNLEPVLIDTTRPELLPACVALVCHPSDDRYKDLIGHNVISPLFKVKVPVHAHELADPEKGTGIAMVCTFGDTTDVEWWRDLNLELRSVVGRDGRILPVEFGSAGFESLDSNGANDYFSQIVGKKMNQARMKIVELLRENNHIVGQERSIRHAVKFFEKGDRPLEIVTSRQWYIKLSDLTEDLARLGKELNWYPSHMVSRYLNWVAGLNGDWNISRQRYFGVPFPLWYGIDDSGSVDFSSPIVPAEADLPIDPSTDVPKGFNENMRGEPGGFIGDPDVMDTWATSSLTPQIAAKYESDEELFNLVFPMDLRPQAHDIIRTWLFSTVVRSYLEHKVLPWKNAAISGWVLDPDRKKMSKSKGNVITPMPLLEKHGADAVRYWSGSGRPGVDTAIDEGQMKVGRRLVIKILNASKFVLGRVENVDLKDFDLANDLTPLDRSILKILNEVIEHSSRSFEQFDYTKALELTETFFWEFCDDYLELVKVRAYSEEVQSKEVMSAKYTLKLTLDNLIRLFAPFLPFVTEEVWSWWHSSSVHLENWPEQIADVNGDEGIFRTAGVVLLEIRKKKTQEKKSLKFPVKSVHVVSNGDFMLKAKMSLSDLQSAGGVEEVSFQVSEITTAPEIHVILD